MMDIQYSYYVGQKTSEHFVIWETQLQYKTHKYKTPRRTDVYWIITHRFGKAVESSCQIEVRIINARSYTDWAKGFLSIIIYNDKKGTVKNVTVVQSSHFVRT